MDYFSASRLESEAITPFFSNEINAMITSRSYSKSKSTRLWIKMDGLQRGVISVVKEQRGDVVFGSDEDAQDTLILEDSGFIVSDSSLAIVNISTGRICCPKECGEIWISNAWNQDSSLETLILPGVDPLIRFHRTRHKGFLWPVPLHEEEQDESGWEGLYDRQRPHQLALFIIGSYDKEIQFDGRLHCVEDLEETVENCFPFIPSQGCVIFHHGTQIICTVEIKDPAQMMNGVFQIILALLKEHRVMLDVISFLNPGMLAKSRLLEKQRIKISTAYKMGKLPILYKHVIRSS